MYADGLEAAADSLPLSILMLRRTHGLATMRAPSRVRELWPYTRRPE